MDCESIELQIYSSLTGTVRNVQLKIVNKKLGLDARLENLPKDSVPYFKITKIFKKSPLLNYQIKEGQYIVGVVGHKYKSLKEFSSVVKYCIDSCAQKIGLGIWTQEEVLQKNRCRVVWIQTEQVIRWTQSKYSRGFFGCQLADGWMHNLDLTTKNQEQVSNQAQQKQLKSLEKYSQASSQFIEKESIQEQLNDNSQIKQQKNNKIQKEQKTQSKQKQQSNNVEKEYAQSQKKQQEQNKEKLVETPQKQQNQQEEQVPEINSSELKKNWQKSFSKIIELTENSSSKIKSEGALQKESQKILKSQQQNLQEKHLSQQKQAQNQIHNTNEQQKIQEQIVKQKQKQQKINTPLKIINNQQAIVNSNQQRVITTPKTIIQKLQQCNFCKCRQADNQCQRCYLKNQKGYTFFNKKNKRSVFLPVQMLCNAVKIKN